MEQPFFYNIINYLFVLVLAEYQLREELHKIDHHNLVLWIDHFIQSLQQLLSHDKLNHFNLVVLQQENTQLKENLNQIPEVIR